MKKIIKNIATTLPLLFGFFVSNLYAQTGNVKILETEYNNSGQLAEWIWYNTDGKIHSK